MQKVKESLSSVLPITAIVFLLCFTVIPVPTDLLMTFVIGVVLLALCQLALFASADDAASLWTLALLPAVSRCASALAVTALRSMSTSQYAAQKKPASHIAILGAQLALCLAGGFFAGGKTALALLGCLAGYALALRRAYRSLDGMNGDISGYALTLGELCGAAVWSLL